MSSRRIAALPMYDFPPLHAVTDAFWSALATRLMEAGVEDVPQALSRDIGHVDAWRHPHLLFGQACQYPLARSWHENVRLVAIPAYRAAGCQGSRYRSVIIVRQQDPALKLQDLRGRRCAVNERDSNSGANLLRAAIAPLARNGRFFSAVLLTGSHRDSATAVASGSADVAAVDCVSYAHLEHLYPHLTASLRVLDWTPSSSGLPFVTARSTDPATLAVLRTALAETLADRALASVRDALLLSGIDFDVDEDYTEVRRLEREAADLGYAELA